MRIALVSPYSWTYPGGVTRHIEALAGQFIAAGHHVRVLAPLDPDDRLARIMHRGAGPQPREPPDYLIGLGRTVGIPSNGAVSNVCLHAPGVTRLRRELRAGHFDVVHAHEPIVPLIAAEAAEFGPAARVGTFHCFSESRLANGIAVGLGARHAFNHLHVRIAVSEAAAWTAQRFFGGRYRIIPNGVDVPGGAAVPHERGDELRIAFVGQAVERKGLSVLLRAFEALRDHIPARLTIIGAGHEEVAPLLLDPTGVRALGKVDDGVKRDELVHADVLCAPSLGGESFGMVLTEAFAAGTPVIASDIAGYRDVVRDGVDGVLVPRADATHLAEALLDLWHEPDRHRALSTAAFQRAQRFAWSRVADEVMGAYDDAIAVPEPRGVKTRLGVALGATPADLKPRVRARRLPSPEPALPGAEHRGKLAIARRIAMFAALAIGAALAAYALHRIGVGNILATLLGSSPSFVLLGLGLMCAAMFVRAISWHAILRAALPRAHVRLRDAMQGTFIGVLMSATLPARLGELSRALIVGRRLGRPREYVPVVLGTVVSQTLLNLLALAILAAVTIGSVGIFQGHSRPLLIAAVAPAALLAAVLLSPVVLRGAGSRSSRLHGLIAQARSLVTQVRSGLVVFRSPRLGSVAAIAQLGAWALQWISCYVLLVALGLDKEAGLGAAAAVLFAVNVTAVLPATPSNLGVFQAACVAVLSGAYGVPSADALGFGIILQVVEVATAILMGMPALLKEGLSWKDVRMRAMHSAPVQLASRSHSEGSRRRRIGRGSAVETES